MAAIVQLAIVCDSEDLEGDVTRMAVSLAKDLRTLEGVDAVFVTGIYTELESSPPREVAFPQVVVAPRPAGWETGGPSIEEVAMATVEDPITAEDVEIAREAVERPLPEDDAPDVMVDARGWLHLRGPLCVKDGCWVATEEQEDQFWAGQHRITQHSSVERPRD